MSLYRDYTQADITSAVAGTAMAVDDLTDVGVQLLAPVAWSGVTVAFQASNDNTNWENIAGVQSTSTARGTGVISTTAVGLFQFDVVAYKYFRINVTARTSGTIRAVISGFRRYS